LDSAKLAGYNMMIDGVDKNARAWATMKAELPNIQVNVFPPDVMAALRTANNKILAENTAKDPIAKRILASRLDYAKIVRPWTDVSERAYLNSRD